MKLHAIEAGNFKLDGGAMFGVVPKTIWQKTNPADSSNLIEMAARCLLIEDGNRLILVDTGMGDKQSEKFFGYYNLWGGFSLDKSLAAAGFHRDDITDVFLTHLHFDHSGGAIQWNSDKTFYEPAFKNAKFWTNANHWEWATHPNPREKASFLSENILPMHESGQLAFVGLSDSDFIKNSELGFDMFLVDGHTEKMMVPVISYKNRKIAFAADLLPTMGHLPIPYVMGYDTRPLLTMPEKTKFLETALAEDWLIMLEHDPHHELLTLERTDRGIRMKENIRCVDFF